MQRSEVRQQRAWLKLNDLIFALYIRHRRLLRSTPFKNLKVAHRLKAGTFIGFDCGLIARQHFQAAAACAGLSGLVEHRRSKRMGQPTPAQRQHHPEAAAPCPVTAQAQQRDPSHIIIQTHHQRTIEIELLGSHARR